MPNYVNSESDKYRTRLTTFEKEQIITLSDSGKSIRDIAELMQRGQATIHLVLRGHKGERRVVAKKDSRALDAAEMEYIRWKRSEAEPISTIAKELARNERTVSDYVRSIEHPPQSKTDQLRNMVKYSPQTGIPPTLDEKLSYIKDYFDNGLSIIDICLREKRSFNQVTAIINKFKKENGLTAHDRNRTPRSSVPSILSKPSTWPESPGTRHVPEEGKQQAIIPVGSPGNN